jgi:hypothetical protein
LIGVVVDGLFLYLAKRLNEEAVMPVVGHVSVVCLISTEGLPLACKIYFNVQDLPQAGLSVRESYKATEQWKQLADAF